MRAAYPKGVEATYRRRLFQRLEVQRRLLREAVTRRADTIDPVALASLQAVRAVRRVFQVELAMDPLELLTLARRVDTWATTRTVKQAEQLIGITLDRPTDLEPLRARWVRDNAALVADLDAQLFDDVATAIVEGRTDLARVVQQRHGVARSRAELIAVNEVGSLNARITQRRQQQAGFSSYEWSSSGDSRVRPEHVALDGTVRRWDQPHPTEGHPGDAIRCRCVAIPVP